MKFNYEKRKEYNKPSYEIFEVDGKLVVKAEFDRLMKLHKGSGVPFSITKVKRI